MKAGKVHGCFAWGDLSLGVYWEYTRIAGVLIISYTRVYVEGERERERERGRERESQPLSSGGVEQ